MNIGDCIKKIRESRGLGVRELQRQCNISNLSRIESGEISPRYETLERIAGGLGVTVADLASIPETTATPEQTEKQVHG